jgi:hypothetical protein
MLTEYSVIWKKAFDCVNHEFLLTKLHYFGIQGATASWFRSQIDIHLNWKNHIDWLVPKLCGSYTSFGLFWTSSIVWYVKDKRPQHFGDWICVRPQVGREG